MPSTVEHLLSDTRYYTCFYNLHYSSFNAPVAQFLTYLGLAFRSDTDKMTGISANLKEIEEGEKFEQSHYFDFEDTAPVKGNTNI
jgi:hypothetical protein